MMKLVSFRRGGSTSCGILTGSGVLDVARLWSGPNPPQGVTEILARGKQCRDRLCELAASADTYESLASLQLCAPIPRPGKVLALAGNYSEHIKEAGRALGLSDARRNTTTPRPFLKPSSCVIGPGEQIPWPVYSQQIDYEVELAVVIGAPARNVGCEQALEYVSGYCIANDVSARSVTYEKARDVRPWDEFYDWLNGKWADGFCPMGPFLVTPDEVRNPQHLDMELTVNGRVRQKANTSQMIYPVADIVSFLSHLMTLEPGDVIATGTPAGVGLADGRFLEAGDKIECHIEGLGVLSNTLGRRPEKFYEPLSGGADT